MPRNVRDIDQAQSLAQLRAGGLPLRASLRLKDEAGPGKRLFTSDLSVSEFLLTREVGCEPISQVMGSSIYHIGRIADYKGFTGEVTQISHAHREARQLARNRLFLEAQAVDADAVIAVRLSERLITRGSHGKGGDDGDEIIELTMVGTAVRAPWIPHPPGKPVVTDLSGQDLWALHGDGYAPTGMVFEFCRYHVWHVLKNWSGGGELGLATESVEEARRIAHNRVLEQAQKRGAEFVVGSDLTVKVREVPCGYEQCSLNDLDIDVTWFGTGVRRVSDAEVRQDVPPLLLSMMPLGRKKADPLLEGDSDSERLAREGEELERERSNE
jgi:uncharacterized protein YbjQ (UPF0145 family)